MSRNSSPQLLDTWEEQRGTLRWTVKTEFSIVSQSKNCRIRAFHPFYFCVIKPCWCLFPSWLCLYHPFNIRVYYDIPSMSSRLLPFVSWQLTWFLHPMSLSITHTEWNNLFFKKILLSCLANYCIKWKSFSQDFLIPYSPSNVIHCTTCSLYSTKASKIAFVVWFQLVMLPEIQFQPSMLIPTIDIEILEYPSLSIFWEPFQALGLSRNGSWPI